MITFLTIVILGSSILGIRCSIIGYELMKQNRGKTAPTFLAFVVVMLSFISFIALAFLTLSPIFFKLT